MIQTESVNTSDPQELDARLRSALEALEKALATPLVEGELADWSRHVEKSWSEAAPLIRQQLDDVHKKNFDEIAKADPEMFKRIDEMEQEDQIIREELERLGTCVERMNRRLPVGEGDPTAPVNDEQKHFVDTGLAYITRVRKQEVVLTTWLLEAFRRERGIAD